ncbi:MAG: hypothetical protein JOZ07_09305 [Solirubrobacterales bacterium]|nr:hypothetical protein [Solirubrobacterales bacterium]
MSDLLAIFEPHDDYSDSPLLSEIERLRPTRVTILIEGVDPSWVDDGEAVRDRLAALMALVERRTGATVVGTAGDRDQLLGWRFDCELCGREPVVA